MLLLLDSLARPLKDLRISVTDRCNFRCPYCMPAEVYGARYQFLPRAEILTFEEILRLTRIFVRLGVSKVRLTGGEPLMRPNLELLIRDLATIDGIGDLTLTTNGYLLRDRAQGLKDSGLKRLTVSLDSLDDAVFKQMNGRGYSLEPVMAGIIKAAEVGLGPIKINAVVQKGINDHTILQLAKSFKGTGHILRFIEYMDVGNLNGWSKEHIVSAEAIVEIIHAELPLVAVAPNYSGEVALRFRYQDGTGEIGVIASVTKPFCGECTRLRLSTDGKIYTCLFANNGYALKELIRSGASDKQLEETIRRVWGFRGDRYSEIRASLSGPQPQKVEMYQLGG